MRSPALLHRPPPSLYIEKDPGVLPPSSSSSASSRLRGFGHWLPHRPFLLISFPFVRYVCSAIFTLFLGYHFGSDSVSRARELELVQKGITKLTNILEGRAESSFITDEWMMLYTTIFNIASRNALHEHSQLLYDKYRESLKEYLTAEVLPALSEKHDEFMLVELVHRWKNYKVMVGWLTHFFCYLNRYYIPHRSLTPLAEVGLTCFRQLVYQFLKDKVRDAVISLINRERNGEQVDKTLLKNVLKIFVEIGSGKTCYYETDFEAHMLRETSIYYSHKASIWIVKDSCPDYMFKAEECLKREKDRVLHYLHEISEPKLLQTVEDELLSRYTNQLLDKKTSGCHVLIRDNKVDDLSRMCRLFYKIPSGMNLISEIFKQHVTAEFTVLMEQAEDAASNKKPEKKDQIGLQELVLVRSVIELNAKYLALSNDCFQNFSPLRKPLREVFEDFCNKGFSGNSCVELLATFCDNTLKKGGTKNPSEAVEETMEKVTTIPIRS
ncbi:Cullin 1 [Musa troglodytarum]|uniref:Cullin 1 n=1 Tax=Musa troglodytarum TaxID=320322 RepID=A0A9E7KR25_9LILI|nr:Cullin 1 [Musa troglodytarum]